LMINKVWLQENTCLCTMHTCKQLYHSKSNRNSSCDSDCTNYGKGLQALATVHHVLLYKSQH
jgi:hypothetical protein